MGREADCKKVRICKHCSAAIHGWAVELIEHSLLCARLKKIGLEMPVIKAPEPVELIIP